MMNLTDALESSKTRQTSIVSPVFCSECGITCKIESLTCFFARFLRNFTEKNIPSQNNARSRLTSSRSDRKQDGFVMRSQPFQPDPWCLLIITIFTLIILLSASVKALYFGKSLSKSALLCIRCWSTNERLMAFCCSLLARGCKCNWLTAALLCDFF